MARVVPSVRAESCGSCASFGAKQALWPAADTLHDRLRGDLPLVVGTHHNVCDSYVERGLASRHIAASVTCTTVKAKSRARSESE